MATRTHASMVRVNADVYEALRQLAVADDRSVTAYINRVLAAHVATHKKGK